MYIYIYMSLWEISGWDGVAPLDVVADLNVILLNPSAIAPHHEQWGLKSFSKYRSKSDHPSTRTSGWFAGKVSDSILTVSADGMAKPFLPLGSRWKHLGILVIVTWRRMERILAQWIFDQEDHPKPSLIHSPDPTEHLCEAFLEP